MELGLKGKIAIVTGGSSGIGKAIALGLTAEGAEVAICARDADKLRETAKEIQKVSGKEPMAIITDVRQTEDVKSFVAKVLQRYGRIDILVNNAGAMTVGPIDKVTDETWHNSVETKVFGFMRFMREVLPIMQKQKYGRIINIVGMSGKTPLPRGIAAGVTNAANLNLSKGIADQAVKFNVLVNTVCPGPTDTPMMQREYQKRAEADGISLEAARAIWGQSVPLGRMGKPEEVANAVIFLASERASFIAGASLNVDGGTGRYIV